MGCGGQDTACTSDATSLRAGTVASKRRGRDEPSIRLPTDKGFQDRFDCANLQVFLQPCASLCASQQPSVRRAGRREHLTRTEGSNSLLCVSENTPSRGFDE